MCNSCYIGAVFNDDICNRSSPSMLTDWPIAERRCTSRQIAACVSYLKNWGQVIYLCMEISVGICGRKMGTSWNGGLESDTGDVS